MFKTAAAIVSALMSGVDLAAMSPISSIRVIAGPGRKHSGLRKTGKTYPHSSTRQRARYARQNAKA